MAEPSDVTKSEVETSIEPEPSLSSRSSASNLASQQDGDSSAQSYEEEPSASESILKVRHERL